MPKKNLVASLFENNTAGVGRNEVFLVHPPIGGLSGGLLGDVFGALLEPFWGYIFGDVWACILGCPHGSQK